MQGVTDGTKPQPDNSRMVGNHDRGEIHAVNHSLHISKVIFAHAISVN